MLNELPSKLAGKLVESGFSSNQALVYLANLKLGMASIWDISEVSGVKRTTCYVVMKELIVKGQASVSNDGKRDVYSVISPNELYYNFIVNRQEVMRLALSEMNALASHSPVKPTVRMFEGVGGVEEAYQMTLELPVNSELLIYGNPELFVNYPEMMERYTMHRIEKKIRVRVIGPDVPLIYEVTKNDAEVFRHTRVLPQNQFDQKTEVNILPNSILYIAHSETKPFATVVESFTMAKEEKNRFEILWKIAVDINKKDVV